MHNTALYQFNWYDAAAATESPMTYDILIKNGTIVYGTGALAGGVLRSE